MSVPAHIRNVPRPVNTVVVDNGKEGPNRFSVRERSGTKYIQHGNPQPRNGKVIGHIFEGKYVPLHTETASEGPDMLSYGAAAFAHSVSSDILSDLLDIYPIKDACTIMAIAILRVIRPSITAERIATHYRRTFVSRYYPGLALSANTICTFQQKIGQDGKRRRDFYQKRASSVMEDHHIAVDGTLKQDNSNVNDLSAFSYKARTKGCREVSILYAYDIEAMEPVCAEVFPTKDFRQARSKKNWKNAPICTFLRRSEETMCVLPTTICSLLKVCFPEWMIMSYIKNVGSREDDIYMPADRPEKRQSKKRLIWRAGKNRKTSSPKIMKRNEKRSE